MARRNNKTKQKSDDAFDEVEDRLRNCHVSESIRFNDVRESLNVFTGDDTYPIVKWIEDFEEMGEICRWSDVELFVYSKRLLAGTAALYLRSEKNIKSWVSLRRSLHGEFHNQLNSADVHRQLSTRIKTHEETHLQYLFKMMEIAKQGDVADDALLDYVIAGIQDSEYNKTLLYGATSVAEFKSKLQLYVKMKSKVPAESKKVFGKAVSRNFGTDGAHQNLSNGSNVIARCYNCGAKDHQHRDCPDLDKGPKCFACKVFGHKSTECPSKESPVTEKNIPVGKDDAPQLYQVNAIHSNERVVKEIKVMGVPTIALIDTGCDLNLCRNSFQLAIKGVNPVDANISLSGPAGATFCAKQKFMANMEVNGTTYSIDVYSVPDEDITYDFIVGRSLFQTKAELRVSPGAVEINSLLSEVQQIMSIEANDIILDIGNKEYVSNIYDMVNCYVPCVVKTTTMKTKIIVKDEQPIYQRPRRLSIKEKVIVDHQIDEWIKEGIIRPSCSDYASPIVIIPKKDGNFRICIDYRLLNNKIIKDRYPLPLIEDQLDKLRGATVFTTLDLRNGFFHVPMDEESIKYTAFITPSGHYEFLKTPFGLCIAPPVFQRFINHVFRDAIRRGYLLIYMDDLVIISETIEENMERLKEVLKTAADHGLHIKWKKCQFLKNQIDYLGYRVECNRLCPSPLKIAAVAKYPKPKNLKHVQSFLGLTGYFRKFIRNYAMIARPLSDLLKKNGSFQYGTEQDVSFNALKQKLTEAPVLSIFNTEAITEVHTDASMYGFGAILLQGDSDGQLHPVYFMSRKTTETQQRYHSYELEVLAIVEAVKKFRCYLLGLTFKVVTDCAAFTRTLEKKELATRVARWALLLSEFDYTIEHRAGSKMAHVDSLSRYPICMTINCEFIARLQRAQQDDPQIKALTAEVVTSGCESHLIENNLLYEVCHDRKLLVIPKAMQKEIIRNAHEVGHFGVKKVVELISREYAIANVQEKVERYIRNCVPCILVNRKQGRKEGFLHPIDKGDLPLDTWHIDFLGPLTNTQRGYKHILAIIDAFTKFCWLFPVKTTATREVIDKMTLLQATFGNPTRLISDRGSAFTSEEFQLYCKETNIQHIRITTGMPRGNGQIERLNDTITAVIAKMCLENPDKWFKYVPKVQMALNSSWQRSIKMTPFKLTFGVEMKHPDLLPLGELIKEEYTKNFMDNREEERQEAKRNILKAQQEQKKTYNRRRTAAVEYQVGDMVAIKRTQFLPMSKIKGKYLGPYQIIKRSGPERYDVQKLGQGEGPVKTSTGTDFMKRWRNDESDESEGDPVSETDSV